MRWPSIGWARRKGRRVTAEQLVRLRKMVAEAEMLAEKLGWLLKDWEVRS